MTKICIIPCCTNTSNNSDKIFLSVPKDANRRKAWFDSFSDQRKMNTSTFYCCEDHFDLPEDAKNWWYYVSMGSHIVLHDHVVPHKYLTSEDGIPPVGSQLTESARKRKLEMQIKLENSRKRVSSKTFASTNDLQLDIQEISFVEIRSEELHYECEKCGYTTDFFDSYQVHLDNCTVDMINDKINKTDLVEIHSKRRTSKRKCDKEPQCNSIENNVSDIVIKEECEISSTDEFDINEQHRNLDEDVNDKIFQNVVKQENDTVYQNSKIEINEAEVDFINGSSNHNLLRLVGRHFPDFIKQRRKESKTSLLCVVCASKNPRNGKRTQYLCKICDVGLCPAPCFRIYHTEINY